MAKYASEHRNKAAVSKFSQELGHSTVKVQSGTLSLSIYLQKLKFEKDPANIVALPHASFGRPLLLSSSLDACIWQYRLLLTPSKTLTLMDAKIGICIKTLNIMDTNFSGFTVHQDLLILCATIEYLNRKCI